MQQDLRSPVDDQFSTQPPTPASMSEPAQAIIDRAKHLVREIDINYISLGRELYLIFHRELFKPAYDTFNEFLEKELCMSRSRGDRVRWIWTKFIRRLHVKPDDLHGIGYCRALALLPVVDEANVNDWVAVAKEATWSVFQAAVAQAKAPSEEVVDAYREVGAVEQKDGNDGAPTQPAPKQRIEILQVPRTPHTYKFDDHQEEVIQGAIDEVKRGRPEEVSTEECLMHICQEFFQSRMTKEQKPKARPRFWMRMMERVYGGKFLWINSVEASEALMRALEDFPDTFVEEVERIEETPDVGHPDAGTDEEDPQPQAP